jgi:deoxynucleoside triphosphate triphosphohydrolase SAMHD1
LITERDERCVAIAALCHDLGHGPFSHLFDGPFLSSILDKKHGWSHEWASTMLFNEILKENPALGIEPDSVDAKFIMNLIEGKPESCPNEKRYLFDIVSNSLNSIDVDKIDYILRDTRCINVPSYQSFNRALITDYMLPIDD